MRKELIVSFALTGVLLFSVTQACAAETEWHDSIKKVDFAPKTISSGQSVNFSVTLFNGGPNTVLIKNVAIVIYISSSETEQFVLFNGNASIASTETKSFTMNIQMPTAAGGHHQVDIIVDGQYIDDVSSSPHTWRGFFQIDNTLVLFTFVAVPLLIVVAVAAVWHHYQKNKKVKRE